MQLSSELEGLQQQLFQQKQQVVALTAQASSMQAELESSRSRLQGESERAASHQQQLEAERKLRMLRSEEVRCAMLRRAMLRWAGLGCAVLRLGAVLMPRKVNSCLFAHEWLYLQWECVMCCVSLMNIMTTHQWITDAQGRSFVILTGCKLVYT